MSRDLFVIGITSLRPAHGERRSERREAEVGELSVTTSRIPEHTPAVADVTLESTDGGIVVFGTVSAPWQGECRRCLKAINGSLEVDVRELFSPPQADRSVDQVDANEESYPIEGETINLRRMVCDSLLLSLPLAPLCSPECAGICPTCGKDLNEGPCECSSGPVDPRWSALDAIRDPDVS